MTLICAASTVFTVFLFWNPTPHPQPPHYCIGKMHPQPFVTSSFNDASGAKWEFSPAPASRITHEYFSGMCGMCHGLWRRLNGLFPSSHNVGSATKPIPHLPCPTGLELLSLSVTGEYFMDACCWEVITNFIRSEKETLIIPTCRIDYRHLLKYCFSSSASHGAQWVSLVSSCRKENT